uniref:Tail completion or Neck11 protein n=1 Tax=Microbacterium phage Sunny TaxID=3144828 RepID=A0AAU7J7X1_9VIRU
MAVKVKINISRGAVVSVVGPIAERAAFRAAQKARGYIISEIRAANRVKTGRMQAGMQVRTIASTGLLRRFEVSSSAPYTIFQNNGTRAHGPRTAKALRFIPKGGSQYVYAKWVRGIEGAHFMEKGVARVRASDFV